MPMAPISPGYGARRTSFPVYRSRDRRTALFRNVPPWTMMLSPRFFRLDSLITLVNTFSMTELQRPAMMSSGVFPFFCSEMTDEFMNTVQREPRDDGDSDLNAISEISSTAMPSDDAKFSRKDPQPALHASFSVMPVMMPLFRKMAFMS